jgi:hypothetical protein
MTKKKQKEMIWKTVLMVVYWALYLTITMTLFERFGVHPSSVPGGFLGWMFIVEIPRVIVGWLISLTLNISK